MADKYLPKQVQSPSLAIDKLISMVDLCCVYDDEYHNIKILSAQNPRRYCMVLIFLNITIAHSISIYKESDVFLVFQLFAN